MKNCICLFSFSEHIFPLYLSNILLVPYMYCMELFLYSIYIFHDIKYMVLYSKYQNKYMYAVVGRYTIYICLYIINIQKYFDITTEIK